MGDTPHSAVQAGAARSDPLERLGNVLANIILACIAALFVYGYVLHYFY